MLAQIIQSLALCPILWMILQIPEPCILFFPHDDMIFTEPGIIGLF